MRDLGEYVVLEVSYRLTKVSNAYLVLCVRKSRVCRIVASKPSNDDKRVSPNSCAFSLYHTDPSEPEVIWAVT
jgi:hypothetical protein